MRIKVRVDQRLIDRAAFVHRKYVTTDCAIALALKQLLPGVMVYGEYIAFTDRNGMENRIKLPILAQIWMKRFDDTPSVLRKQLPNLVFEMDIPDQMIQVIGAFQFKEVLMDNTNVMMAKLAPVMV
jgi:hypothetical protein